MRNLGRSALEKVKDSIFGGGRSDLGPGDFNWLLLWLNVMGFSGL